MEETGLKLVPSKVIRKVAPAILSRKKELKKLSEWRRTLNARQKRLESLGADVHQMMLDLIGEANDWVAEADRISSLPFGDIDEISIALTRGAGGE